MTLLLLDLRAPKEIPAAQKPDWPVSIARQPDGTPLIVSRFGDDRWDFYPYMPQEILAPSGKIIDWRIRLSDATLLTDPKHSGLLQSAKDFIWSLFADPVEGKKRPKMLTIRSVVVDLIPLLRWMVNMNIERFADLDGRTFDYVPVAKLNKAGKTVSETTAGARLYILEALYLQRAKLDDALATHPWPHETAGSLTRGKGRSYSRTPSTEFIPDVIASLLVSKALDYVKNRSTRILTTLVDCDAVAERGGLAGGTSISVRSSLRTAAAQRAGYSGHMELVTESILLRTACFIIVNLFSGIRASEMMSIPENCISEGKSKDGTTDVLWLHGTIYKTGIRPKKWLVPPVVKEAVGVLARLTAPLRESLQEEELDIQARIGFAIAKERQHLMKRLDSVHKYKDKLFVTRSKQTKGTAISVLSASSANYTLRQFCKRLGINGDDGKPYGLHTHQFRRTYARFVARAELGDLLTLRDHFGHWSIDMTTYYADGGADEYEVDVELLDMVAKEKQDRQTEIMTAYVDSDSPLANGSHWLKEWRTTVRTAANKEELIAEFTGSLTLNGTGHSWCVGNAKGTNCGGLCVFEADMCVDCRYGIIGQEHLPVWKGIAIQQEEALAMPDLGIPGKARAQSILEKARKVIAKLEAE